MMHPDHTHAFDRNAEQWWNANGPMRVLHAITVPRCCVVVNALRDNPRWSGWSRGKADPHTHLPVGWHALDIGCGGGLMSEPLARLGAHVTGVDESETLIEVARAHARQSGLHEALTYRAQSAQAFLAATPPHSFDVVVCFELLEHVQNPAAVVQAAARCLRDGGVALFSTIDRTTKAKLLAIDVAERVLGWIPKGTHAWEQFIRPATLASWCQHAGLEVTRIQGLAYSPLRAGWHITPRPAGVNYFLNAYKPCHH